MLTENQLAPSLLTPEGVFSEKIDDRIFICAN